MDDTAFTAFGSSAAGALVGSLSAFALAVIHQRREEKNKRHASLLKAFYALLSQWTMAKGIENDLLADLRNQPNAYLQMKEFRIYGRPSLVSFEEIAFIAASDEPDLLQQIHIAEQRFDTLISTLEAWTELAHKIKHDYPPNAEGYVQIPQHMLLTADSYWRNLLQSANDAIPKLKTEFQAVTSHIARVYNGKKVPKIRENPPRE